MIDSVRGDISGPTLSKAEVKRNTTFAREHGRLLRVAALHFDGRPDADLLRAVANRTLERTVKSPRAAYLIVHRFVAALLILQGFIDDPAEVSWLQMFAKGWRRDDPLAAPALLAHRPR